MSISQLKEIKHQCHQGRIQCTVKQVITNNQTRSLSDSSWAALRLEFDTFRSECKPFNRTANTAKILVLFYLKYTMANSTLKREDKHVRTHAHVELVYFILYQILQFCPFKP